MRNYRIAVHFLALCLALGAGAASDGSDRPAATAPTLQMLEADAVEKLAALERAKSQWNLGEMARAANSASQACRRLAEAIDARFGASRRADSWLWRSAETQMLAARVAECEGRFDVAADSFQKIADSLEPLAQDKADELHRIRRLAECAASVAQFRPPEINALATARLSTLFQQHCRNLSSVLDDKTLGDAGNAVATLERLVPSNHEWLVEGLIAHATLLDYANRPRDATMRFAEAGKSIVAHLDPNDTRRLECLCQSIGMHLVNSRDLEAARRDLAIARKVLAAKHSPDRFDSYRILRYDLAIASTANDRVRVRECIKELGDTFGPLSDDARSLEFLAHSTIILWRAGESERPSRMLAKLRMVLDQRDLRSVDGRTLGMLAIAECRFGSRTQGEKYFDESLRQLSHETHFGHSFNYASALLALTNSRLAIGQSEGLRESVDIASEIFREQLGPTSQLTLEARLCSVRVALYDGQIDEAEVDLTNLQLELATSLLADSPLAGQAKATEALLHWAKGRPADAESAYDAALRIFRSTLGPESREAEDAVAEAMSWRRRQAAR